MVKKLPIKISSGVRTTGFTLVELLTIIAIVGLLAAIVIPILSNVRSKAEEATSLSNLREIGKATGLFVNDNGYLPPAAHRGESKHWQDYLNPYLGGEAKERFWDEEPLSEALFDPRWKEDVNYNPARHWNTGYGMNVKILRPDSEKEYWPGYGNPENNTWGVKPLQVRFPSNTIYVGTSDDWHYYSRDLTRWDGQSHVLFVDGHVAVLSPDQANAFYSDPGMR